ILEKEAELIEIVRLVGMETLSSQDRLILETARAIREDFLHQSAFDDRDAYTTLTKQYRMLRAIMLFHSYASKAIEKGVSIDKIHKMPVKEGLVKMRYIAHSKVEEDFDKLEQEIQQAFSTFGIESKVL
ncbi:MAG: V-type ATP synthase subunit A, partial [Candidatus Omnitrophica bacterium]|nr:V-type ATP synthase subunit A [Candidatus Omnitrophota bacterium]